VKELTVKGPLKLLGFSRLKTRLKGSGFGAKYSSEAASQRRDHLYRYLTENEAALIQHAGHEIGALIFGSSRAP
jgi:hypothetical protein